MDSAADVSTAGIENDVATQYSIDQQVLVIENLTVTDPDVLREASRWVTGERGEPATEHEMAVADLSAFASEALIVGSRVLAIAAQSSDTLAVQQAVKSAGDQVDDAVRRATDQMGAATRAAHETVMAQVTNLVGGENPELLERLRPVLARLGTDLERQVADGIEKANAEVRADSDRRHVELTALIRDVRQEVAVRVAEQSAIADVKESTTIKGFDYEAQVNLAFEQIALSLGEEYRETGAFAGKLPRNKKGDGVLVLSDDMARIVIEVHDGSTKDWGSYLAEAERNRGACASIGVVKHQRDNAGHAIRVIGSRRVIVVWNPDDDDLSLLRTVTLLMRTVALTSSGRFGVEEVAAANEHIKEALSILADLDEAKRSAAAIRGHVDKIETVTTKAMTAAQRELTGALNALTGVRVDKSEATPDVA
jgi:hypothetical protein